MTARWYFKELRPGDKDRQPTQGEFFATDAIKSMAEALVRESIQNSLDASTRSTTEQVHVRFYLATGDRALPWSITRKYFEGGWHHFTAPESGLDDAPRASDRCPFLLIEDFGTSGLVGDVNQWKHVAGAKNPFYYFFRTEGRSGKSENDRGRWGIGKYVFPRSSRISAFAAMTVRADDGKRLLMGQSVLKSHTIGDKYYTPDGDYGIKGTNDLIMPIQDEDFINQFCSDFQLKRTEKSGLSVVIPWIDAQITHEGLLSAIIEDYFFPILTGALVVTLESTESSIRLAKDSLFEAVDCLSEDLGKGIRPLMELAAWARDVSDDQIIKLNPANPQRPSWQSSLLPTEIIDELRQKYRSGERIALEVPLTVRERRVPDRESFFRVFLLNDGIAEGKPVFIRDGIIISDVRSKWTTGVTSLVVIEHSALANLLGDSENPAHTQWQKDREHFRRKYTYGKSYIDFVSQSVSMFVRFLNESDSQPERDLLKEIFSIPKASSTNEPKEKSRPRKRNKGETITDIPHLEPRRRRFTLMKVAGGFTVTRGASDVSVPDLLEIAVAYDRRRGSPIKKYSPSDFILSEKPIRVDLTNAMIEAQDRNHLLVRIANPEFTVSVTGFDENRDLFVDVKAKERRNDSQA